LRNSARFFTIIHSHFATCVLENVEGTILFAREAGYVVSAREKFRIKGDNMTYEVMGKELDGAIDFTIESVTQHQPVGK
jgi:hypothetical protein